MGAPTSVIASNPTASGGNVTPSSGGKGGKSGMSSIQPSNQTLTANTAQPAMGAPAAYSNTISPNTTDQFITDASMMPKGGLDGSPESIGQNSMNSGKSGGSVINQPGFQSQGKGQ